MNLRDSVQKLRRLPHDEALLWKRISLLEPADAALLEAVLIRGQAATTVARMIGRPERTVRARVHRLCRRIASRTFIDAFQALPLLPPDDAKLARLHFCGGVSRRQLARRLGRSPHSVRRRLEHLQAQIELIKRLRRASRGAAAAWRDDEEAGSGRRRRDEALFDTPPQGAIA